MTAPSAPLHSGSPGTAPAPGATDPGTTSSAGASPADPGAVQARPTGGRRAAVWLIHAYQVARAGHVSPCRFTPTCSEYAVQAVSAHGVRRGVALSARRLIRCRPRGSFGYDPVPPGPFPPDPLLSPDPRPSAPPDPGQPSTSPPERPPVPE